MAGGHPLSLNVPNLAVAQDAPRRSHSSLFHVERLLSLLTDAIRNWPLTVRQ